VYRERGTARIRSKADAAPATGAYGEGMTGPAAGDALTGPGPRRSARHHPHLADLADTAMALAVYAATLITTVTGPPPWRGQLDPAALLTAGVACGALAVRRRWPFPMLLVSAVAAEAYLAMHKGHEGTLVLAAPLIALYTVADTANRRRALTIGASAVLALGVLHVLIKPASWAGAENVALAALGGLAVAAGDASRNRRAYLAEVEERARRAEHDREEQARRRVTEERLRIARDLHDALGHQLALINVQAGVTAYVAGDQPAPLLRALTSIRQASRTALHELRDTIGLLREPGEPAAPTEPTMGVAALDDLVASFRGCGVDIRVDVSGTVRELAPAADRTAYRVVQEALTNVCKHAAPATARLRLEYGPTALRITVDDDGTRPGEATTGHGITGMRERATAVGGSLDAGPRPGGGFRVHATLPVEPLPVERALA
jgi:signal transduction histidine kinase